MIKINLLKNKVNDARTSATIGETTFSATTSFETMGDNKGALVNLLLMFVFVVPLIFYENMVQNDLNAQVTRVRAESAKIKKDLDQKKARQKESAKVEAELQELQSKIEVVRKLSKYRVRELKALDFLQTVIPDRVWMTSIKYEADKLDLEGMAIADEDLTEFVKRLEARKFFSSVLLLQARESQSKEGTVKTFQVSCNLEIN